jgi:hypothetical protein
VGTPQASDACVFIGAVLTPDSAAVKTAGQLAAQLTSSQAATWPARRGQPAKLGRLGPPCLLTGGVIGLPDAVRLPRPLLATSRNAVDTARSNPAAITVKVSPRRKASGCRRARAPV